jgi:hypothetical protein
MSKPILVLVPGSFHTPVVFDQIRHKLEALSYTVLTPSLPSVGEDNAFKNWKHDTAALNAVAEPYMNQGCECVMIAHSYGATPAIAAVCEEGVPIRQLRGLKGGWSKILLCGAIVCLEEGVCIAEANGGGQPDWCIGEEQYVGVGVDRRSGLSRGY